MTAHAPIPTKTSPIGSTATTNALAQLRSRKVHQALERHQVVGSMGQVGAAGGNAMESSFSLLQNSVLDRRHWATYEELRIAIVTWIERTYHAGAHRQPWTDPSWRSGFPSGVHMFATVVAPVTVWDTSSSAASHAYAIKTALAVEAALATRRIRVQAPSLGAAVYGHPAAASH